MRYLLLDRVIRIEHGERILALKNTSLAEDVYAEHFVGFPVMPGALMVESVAQAGTLLVETSSNLEHKAILTMIENAKCRAGVRPGDQLIIEVVVESWKPDHVRSRAKIHVGDRPVMDARLVFGLKDVNEFYPLRTRHMVESFYEFLLKDAERVGFSNDSPGSGQ